MRKAIFTTFILLLMGLTTWSQSEAPVNLDSLFPIQIQYSELNANRCVTPEVKTLALVQYENYTKAYLELEGGPVNQSLSYRLAGTSGFIADNQTTDGKALFTNLLPNRIYEVKLTDNCGNSDHYLKIDTKVTSGEMLTVSNNLYTGIVNYIAAPNGVQFPAYLENLQNVSPYEKLALMQQLFFRGQPFRFDSGTQIPTVPDNPDGDDACFCNAIRTVQSVEPGNIYNGVISDQSQPGGGNIAHMGGDNNTRTWQYLNNKGAAKWHNLWTEGYKSEPGVDYEKEVSWASTNSNVSYQHSWLRVAFICMDGDTRLPEACQCEKDIDFWYGYDTQVKTVAELREGAGQNHSKNAVAQVEDMALAYFLRESPQPDIQMLNKALARAESHCERTINEQYWTNNAALMGQTVTFLGSVFSVVQGSSSNISQNAFSQLGTAVQNYFNTLNQAMNTPYYNPTTCTEKSESASMQGHHSTALRPNEPVVMGITSFDKLFAGGRRAWHSYARINSNFSLAGYLRSNANDGTPRHCCSPKTAMWVVGSCDGPVSTEVLKIRAANLFWTAGLSTGYQTTNAGNGRTMPSDYGWISEPSTDSGCNSIIVNDGGGGGTGGH